MSTQVAIYINDCATRANWVVQNRWRIATLDGRLVEEIVGNIPLASST